MDTQDMLTVAELGLRLADALHEISEELREFRKEHTAMRQQVEHIQAAVSFYVGTSAERDRP